ncbi:MAG: hypothetical protein OEY48_06065, partial [Gammaproteobacteria bacterium]|nr:hypothetical protein [Gammaproteobacteria bacterium]
QEKLIEGRVTQAQSIGETRNTVTVSEQEPTSIRSTGVVEQPNESQETGFDQNNPGGSIDITA